MVDSRKEERVRVIFSTGQWPAWLALLCGLNIGEVVKWRQNVIKMVREEKICIDKWHQNVIKMVRDEKIFRQMASK